MTETTDYARRYIDTIVAGVDYEARDDNGLLANLRAIVVEDCKGPNRACRKAHKAGLTVHVVPPKIAAEDGTLVLPTYHYATIQAAADAIHEAWFDAPTVHTFEARDRAYREAMAIWIAHDIH